MIDIYIYIWYISCVLIYVIDIWRKNVYIYIYVGPKSHLKMITSSNLPFLPLLAGEHDRCGSAGMSKSLGTGQCVPCVAGGLRGSVLTNKN